LQHLYTTEFPGLALTDNKTGIFFKRTFDIMIKLQAMSYHLSNFRNYDRLFEKRSKEIFDQKKHSVAKKIQIDGSKCLLFEIEAFLFQMKSALDMSVKILEVLFPPGFFKTKTFTNKGTGLIKNLNNLLNTNKVNRRIIPDIISMIENNQNSWINKTIDLRDKLSHYETITGYSYFIKIEEERFVLEKPKILGYDPLVFMRKIFFNCIMFIQDLLSHLVVLRSSNLFLVETNKFLNQSDGTQYIRYSLGVKFKTQDGMEQTGIFSKF